MDEGLVFQQDDLLTNMVHECTVVRHNDECLGRARTAAENAVLKPHDSEKIKEVGRFIQYHDISILENIDEHAAHLPA